MMFGGYGKGGKSLPRVLHVSIARAQAALPLPDETLAFLVSLHEEGSGITWQQNVSVPPDTEKYFVDTVQELYWWSQNLAFSAAQARDRLEKLGARLFETFIGPQALPFWERITPTALLLDVDETVLNLPWELMAPPAGPLALEVPFGRLVTTRILPRASRDPLQEDNTVRILVVANPTGDLPAGEDEAAAIQGLRDRGAFRLESHALIGKKATRAAFRKAVAGHDFDILHFTGHSYLDPAHPEVSALQFADGPLSADDVLDLPWSAPPYLVFNSACESGRAVAGLRLVSAENHHNGLAAGFLAAGVYGYAGYFWPVTDGGATEFAMTFYEALFGLENVGLAFLEARRALAHGRGTEGDLTGSSAVLYGDAASEHRRDFATAA